VSSKQSTFSSSDKTSVILLLDAGSPTLLQRRKKGCLKIPKWLFRPVYFEVFRERERSKTLRKMVEKSSQIKSKTHFEQERYFGGSPHFIRVRSIQRLDLKHRLGTEQQSRDFEKALSISQDRKLSSSPFSLQFPKPQNASVNPDAEYSFLFPNTPST